MPQRKKTFDKYIYVGSSLSRGQFLNLLILKGTYDDDRVSHIGIDRRGDRKTGYKVRGGCGEVKLTRPVGGAWRLVNERIVMAGRADTT